MLGLCPLPSCCLPAPLPPTPPAEILRLWTPGLVAGSLGSIHILGWEAWCGDGSESSLIPIIKVPKDSAACVCRWGGWEERGFRGARQRPQSSLPYAAGHPPTPPSPGTFRRGEGAGTQALGAEAAGRGDSASRRCLGAEIREQGARRGRPGGAGPGRTGGAGAPCGRPGPPPAGPGQGPSWRCCLSWFCCSTGHVLRVSSGANLCPALYRALTLKTQILQSEPKFEE